MIHSLSGGVIRDGGLHTFVKVNLSDGTERWYLCDDFPVAVGMKVIVPVGEGRESGEVVRVDGGLGAQATPVPLKHAISVLSVVFDEE